MMTRKLDELSQELLAERAAALARTAAKLERTLAELVRLEGQLVSASPTARPRLLEEHGRTRDEALRYRWYLVVQREAMGLYDHRIVDETYPVPRRAR